MAPYAADSIFEKKCSGYDIQYHKFQLNLICSEILREMTQNCWLLQMPWSLWGLNRKSRLNSFFSSGDLCRLLIPLQTVLASVLLWIQTVWHSYSVPEISFKKVSRQQQKPEKLLSMQGVKRKLSSRRINQNFMKHGRWNRSQIKYH